MILTIDQVNDLLDEMAEGFPDVLFDELNGRPFVNNDHYARVLLKLD